VEPDLPLTLSCMTSTAAARATRTAQLDLRSPPWPNADSYSAKLAGVCTGEWPAPHQRSAGLSLANMPFGGEKNSGLGRLGEPGV